MTALGETHHGGGAARGARAESRLSALQAATAELARAMDEGRIAEVVVDHGVRALGAVTAALWLVAEAERGGDARGGAPPREAHLVRSLGYPEAVLPPVRVMRVDGAAPASEALRERRPVFLESYAAYAERYPRSESRVREHASPRGAIACVPLVHGDALLGLVSFTFAEPRAFAGEDASYFDLLASHAVQALERARLWKAERRAREHIEVLYAFAGAAMRAESLDQVLDPALEAVCRALGAPRASILLFDERGTMRFRAWRGLSERYRAAVDGHSPWQRDAKDPQPIVVADVSADEGLARYGSVFEDEGIRSLAFVPLVHEKQLLGKFMIYASEPRALTAEDVRLASTIATQIAQAVASHEARAETLRAKAAAEDAARAREQLLAVVAHDLRNPLGVVRLKAEVMGARAERDASESGAKARKDAEVIARNTDLMTRLISDLVDVAAIEAGSLSLERSSCAASDVLAEAAEHARPLVEARGARLVVRDAGAGARVLVDRQRVVQVFSNLVGNALAFSPEGGAVTLEAAPAQEGSSGVAFAVCDEGPGIAAHERERVFEANFRGANDAAGSAGAAPARRPNGIGLGLYIARGIVGAHGGRIRVEDPAAGSRGARVVFTLPCA